MIEQILASHPKVHGAGELPDVRRVFQSLPTFVGLPSADPFDALAALDPISTRAAAQGYLYRLSCACAPDVRPHRRQDARQRRSSGPDCLALALGSSDHLPKKSTRRGRIVLANRFCVDPLGE